MYSNRKLTHENNIVHSHAQHYVTVSPSILDRNSEPFEYRWGKRLTVVDETGRRRGMISFQIEYRYFYIMLQMI